MIEKTLYLLLSELNIALFPMVIPQEVDAPAVTYLRLRTHPTNSLSGTNRRNDNADFQIDIWGRDYLRTVGIAEQIIDKMSAGFGAASLLRENKDEPYELPPGIYHRILIFLLRENRTEGGS